MDKIELRINKLVKKRELLILKGIVSRIISSKEIFDQSFDEIKKLGKITVGQKDDFISIKSNYAAKDVEQMHENAKKNLPLLKRQIDQSLEEIEGLILDDFNPLDVVAFVSSKNLLFDPETYSESSFKGRQLCPEIVQNIV